MKLACANGHILVVPIEVARVSELICGLIEDGADLKEAIPVPQVKKEVMDKVMIFCEY